MWYMSVLLSYLVVCMVVGGVGGLNDYAIYPMFRGQKQFLRFLYDLKAVYILKRGFGGRGTKLKRMFFPIVINLETKEHPAARVPFPLWEVILLTIQGVF